MVTGVYVQRGVFIVLDFMITGLQEDDQFLRKDKAIS